LVHPIAGLYCLPVYFRPSLSIPDTVEDNKSPQG